MNINLIDTLLGEQPIIDSVNHKINSTIPLSSITGGGIIESDFVIFDTELDNLSQSSNKNKFRGRYLDLGISEKFMISRKLLHFFIFDELNGNGDRSISDIFTMDKGFVKNKKISLEVYKFLVNKFNYLKEGNDGYLIYGKKNIKIRYGKFINMLFKMIHKEQDNGQQIVEKYVDYYKVKFNTDEFHVSLLSGIDVLVGYDTRYHRQIRGTMLQQSCMNNKFDYLKMYTVNPDKIYLFVVTNNDGKIVSRNLICRLKDINNFLFDRVYAIDTYISNIVDKIAKSENWVRHKNGSHNRIHDISKINDVGVIEKIDTNKIEIKLSFKGVKKYPYLDTFKSQRLLTNTLTNVKMRRFSYEYSYTGGSRSRVFMFI